jgi:hypothetical protein
MMLTGQRILVFYRPLGHATGTRPVCLLAAWRGVTAQRASGEDDGELLKRILRHFAVFSVQFLRSPHR